MKADNYLDDKLKEIEKERIGKLIPFVLSALAGFCFAKVDVLGGLSPFTAAFLAAVPFEYCIGVFIGGAVGYLSSFASVFTVRQVLCLGVIGLVGLLVHKRLKKLEGGFFPCILALSVVGAFSVGEQVILGGDFVEMCLAVIEGVIAFFSCWFFLKSFRLPIKRIGIFNLPVGDRLCLGISVFTFVMCASGVSVEGFSPARLCCFAVICFAAYCKGVPAGSTLGVCLGAALSVAPESRFVFPAFALSGLIGGVFAPMGQVAVGVSACLAFCASCLIGGFEDIFILPMIECAAASALFMLMPPAWLTRLMELVKKNGAISDDCVNLQVSAILRQASGNIYSFCKTVDEVSERLDRIINPEVNKLFFDVQQRVCDGCGEKTACLSCDYSGQK